MFRYRRDNVSVLTVIDRRRRKKSGKFPVKVEVVFRREQKYYPTGIDMTAEEWGKLPSSRRLAMERSAVAEKFERVVHEAIPLISTGNFSFDILQKRLGRNLGLTLSDALEHKGQECLRDQRINSYYRYRSTGASIRRVAKDVPICMVTEAWLKDYTRGLMLEGKSNTTINIYLKTIKVVMRKAVQEGYLSQSQFPFGKGDFKVPRANTRNMALTMEQIKKLMEYGGNPLLEKYRDLWLFSYLCNGINFRDMLFLRWSDVIDGEVCFVRSKTMRASGGRKVIRATMTEKMRDILSRWGNPDNGGHDAYLFPYAEKTNGGGGVAKSNLVRKVIALCNKALRHLSAELGLPHFTTYSARHSYATILQQKGVAVSYISQSLGHSSINVTESYLEGFDRSERERNAQLLTTF